VKVSEVSAVAGVSPEKVTSVVDVFPATPTPVFSHPPQTFPCRRET